MPFPGVLSTFLSSWVEKQVFPLPQISFSLSFSTTAPEEKKKSLQHIYKVTVYSGLLKILGRRRKGLLLVDVEHKSGRRKSQGGGGGEREVGGGGFPYRNHFKKERGSPGCFM